MADQDFLAVIEKILSKVEIEGKDGCWRWQGSLTRGYGAIKIDSEVYQIHRFIYECVTGPIPEGYQIDHLCRTRNCINPDHLEAVTPRVNTLRGISIPALNGRKTYCVNGHCLDGANTYFNPTTNFRNCLICKRLSNKLTAREHRQRMKVKGTNNV